MYSLATITEKIGNVRAALIVLSQQVYGQDVSEERRNLMHGVNRALEDLTAVQVQHEQLITDLAQAGINRLLPAASEAPARTSGPQHIADVLARVIRDLRPYSSEGTGQSHPHDPHEPPSGVM